MNLNDDDFALFGLPRKFELNEQRLAERWKALQLQVHPDRFANSDKEAQRLSLQWSTRINDAYRRLKDPIHRAAYLCELGGFAVKESSAAHMPAEFLELQWRWREELEEAQTEEQRNQIQQEIEATRVKWLDECQACLDQQPPQFERAVVCVTALQFIERVTRTHTY